MHRSKTSFLAPFFPASGQLGDETGEFDRVPRLGNVRVKSCIKRLPRIRRKGDDLRLSALSWFQFPDLANETEAILFGHRDITECNVGLEPGESCKAGFSGSGCFNLRASGLQDRQKSFACVFQVIDDQHADAA